MTFKQLNLTQAGILSFSLIAGLYLTNDCQAATPVTSSAKSGAEISAVSNTYLGGLLGVSSMNEQRGSGVGYNLQGAHYFLEQVGAGLFVQGGGYDKGLSSFFYGAQALFRPTFLLPGLQLGGLLARGRFSAGEHVGDTNLAYGMKAAYDIQLSDQYPITAGLDLSVLMVKPTEVTYTIFSPLASVKLWL